jgi:hypothetical protein
MPTTFGWGNTGKVFYNTQEPYFRFRNSEGGVFNAEFCPWRRDEDDQGCAEVGFI